MITIAFYHELAHQRCSVSQWKEKPSVRRDKKCPKLPPSYLPHLTKYSHLEEVGTVFVPPYEKCRKLPILMLRAFSAKASNA